MPLINLIHEQRALVRRREQQARIGFLILTGSVGIGVFGSAALLLQTAFIRSEKARLNSELQRLEPLSREIVTNGNEMGRLQPRVKTLEDARKMTDRWRAILTHLTVNTPRETWLTTLRAVGDDPNKPVTLTFDGMGLAQAPIGELLLRTQNCEDLKNVRLNFTEERVTNQTKAISFEFLADVTGTEPATAKDGVQ